ncbi:MAG: carbohydrate kinase family protein [Clostridiales bacterium]|nr:carbohydrate kinase family protein [Clostridiales bacterium]
MGIVVLGSVFVDIKGYPLSQYIPGGRNAGRVEYVHGGVSRNIAEDIGNMELRPTFISLVDETGVGQDVLIRLRKHKVNTDYIRIVPGGMGTWLAVFDNNNDVCASISCRPDLSPILDILEASGDEIFSAADSVLLEMDMEAEIVKEVFRLCEKYGKRVYAAVSNINIAMERRDFFQKADGFVCNRGEAEILFSSAFSGSCPEEIARELSALVAAANIPSMVVTLGGDGAVWADRNGMYGACPARSVHVADTTGAGDAFFAGVAAGLTYGKSLPEACDIGTRLAASVIGSRENTCPRFLPEEFGLPSP